MIIVLILFFRLVFILPWSRFSSKILNKCKAPRSLLVFLGSGGHTAEMCSLIPNLSCQFSVIYSIIASGDDLSEHKLQQFAFASSSESHVYRIWRTRDIHESLLHSVPKAFVCFLQSLKILLQTKPQMILVNGPGTCVPIVYAAFILKYLGLFSTRAIYVESVCRVSSLSLSAKLVYPVVNELIVQWPDNNYFGTRFFGKLT
ncbi:hypothetical protein GEMRC1_007186 [Eukaryota sp. GEM-RC1]